MQTEIAWQRRGGGLYWESYEKEGYNPRLNQKVTARRQRIKVDRELPIKEEYGQFIQGLLTGICHGATTESPGPTGE